MSMAMGNSSPTSRRRFGVALAICAFAYQSSAGAAGVSESAPKGADAKQEAKARFVTGQSHYNLNEYAEALIEFKEAYRLLPDPVFLFNLGQCERQLGNQEEAIRFYRSFLREQPKAPNRQEVTRKIEEMEAALKTKQAEEEKPVAPPAVTEPAPAAGEAAKSASPAVVPVKPNPAPTPVATPEPAARPASPPPAAPVFPTNLPLAAPPAQAEIAAASTNRIDLTATAATPSTPEQPAFYSHWWFWTAAVAIVAGAGAGIYAATATKAPAVPSSTLGSKKVF